jgi:hypothetical protein
VTQNGEKGEAKDGSSLLGPPSTLVMRTARAPWPETVTPHGRQRHGVDAFRLGGLGSTARYRYRQSPATNRWDKVNGGERKEGPAGKFTSGGAGTVARLCLTRVEHGRGRRSSSTGDGFGRRRPGDGEASASLKNGRAQLG